MPNPMLYRAIRPLEAYRQFLSSEPQQGLRCWLRQGEGRAEERDHDDPDADEPRPRREKGSRRGAQHEREHHHRQHLGALAGGRGGCEEHREGTRGGVVADGRMPDERHRGDRRRDRERGLQPDRPPWHGVRLQGEETHPPIVAADPGWRTTRDANPAPARCHPHCACASAGVHLVSERSRT